MEKLLNCLHEIPILIILFNIKFNSYFKKSNEDIIKSRMHSSIFRDIGKHNNISTISFADKKIK